MYIAYIMEKFNIWLRRVNKTLLPNLRLKLFENILGKGENVGNQGFVSTYKVIQPSQYQISSVQS